jgi:hypothetical protein
VSFILFLLFVGTFLLIQSFKEKAQAVQALVMAAGNIDTGLLQYERREEARRTADRRARPERRDVERRSGQERRHVA